MKSEGSWWSEWSAQGRARKCGREQCSWTRGHGHVLLAEDSWICGCVQACAVVCAVVEGDGMVAQRKLDAAFVERTMAGIRRGKIGFDD